jgi:tricorn protease
LHHAWSPDSRWLAYTRNSPTYINRMWLHSLADGKSWPLTDGLADASFPVFDPNGKYLYFMVSTDAGPVQDWFSQSSADLAASRSIYLAVLAKSVPSPLAKESDEEGVKKEEAPKAGDPKATPKPVVVTIDPDGLSQRIVALPPKPAGFDDLQVGATGQLFYRKEPGARRGGDTSLVRFDLEKRKEDTLTEAVNGYEVSRDGKRVLVKVKEAWSVCDLADKLDLAKEKLKLDSVQVRIDPVAEWAQIFDEAWRINRDYFYAPNMHGVDWAAQKKKYEAFLPHVATRSDLNRVMQWMFSELAVGHHRVGGGDSLAETRNVPGGLLGADYEIANGRYRLKKVYGGLNWNPQMRAPLTSSATTI